MNARIEALKENICIKAVKDVRRGYKVTEEGRAYRASVRLCLERARLLTESYKESEGEPMVIRRAKALAHILENMTVYIKEGELIVGNLARDPSSLPYYPELYWSWLAKAVNDGYRDLMDEKGREELPEINKYWRNKAVHGMERDILPEDVKKYWRYNGAAFWTHHWYNALPDYDKLLKKGLNGLIKEAEDKLAELEADYATIPVKEYIEKKRFLEGVIISLQGAIKFARRYGEKARELANAESDPGRKKELERIEEICENVPANPARSFHEGLQLFFFIHLIASFIELPLIGIGVRLDQILYPFYEKDVEEGRITAEEALELIQCLWIKFEEMGFLHPPMWSGIGGGGLAWQNVTIGGVTADGEDATNDLTYMMLEATEDLQSVQPPLEFRYHTKTPKELVFKAIDVLSTGVAQPAFFNDDVLIPFALENGASIEEARDYTVSNCMFWVLPGKMVYRPGALGYAMLPKFLELALNRGIDKFSGEQIGYPTPDPTTFSSIEDIMDAFLCQYRFFIDKIAYISKVADMLYEEYLPRPFISALLDGCIQKGEDCSKWKHHRWTIILNGAVNVADSLAAIKKLVFEEQRFSMEELLGALKNNWEGREREEMRQIFLNEAPKFGNDDDYVDLITREVYYRIKKESEKFTHRGVPLTIDGSVVVSSYNYAGETGATPDGRKDGEPFHDGSISPAQGRDKKGPTAVLRSVSKVDPLLSWNLLLNQRFSPMYLRGDNKEVFAHYLRTWADLGIHHIQFNVVDKEMLVDAQKHPEKYTDLIVRVAGYAAYFVDLSKGLQEDIITRTEQSF